jgi:hypothetical protein
MYSRKGKRGGIMKIKGLKKVNRIVNRFTKKFGVTAKPDTEFEAFCDRMTIGYALTCDKDDKAFFIADAEKRYPDIKADIFLWCLMHEIGHCVTDGFWSYEEQAYFTEQKEAMTNIEDDQLRNDWYHACPDEFFATKWAGDYMRKHPKEIARFWKKVQKAIIQVYLKNNVN